MFIIKEKKMRRLPLFAILTAALLVTVVQATNSPILKKAKPQTKQIMQTKGSSVIYPFPDFE